LHSGHIIQHRELQRKGNGTADRPIKRRHR
jgi:hypothetical protein